MPPRWRWDSEEIAEVRLKHGPCVGIREEPEVTQVGAVECVPGEVMYGCACLTKGRRHDA